MSSGLKIASLLVLLSALGASTAYAAPAEAIHCVDAALTKLAQLTGTPVAEFSPGDYVEIGRSEEPKKAGEPNNPEKTAKTDEKKPEKPKEKFFIQSEKAEGGGKFTFHDSMLPAVGRFERWDRFGDAIVSMTYGGRTASFRVKKPNLRALATANEERFYEKSKLFINDLEFAPGERLLYRGADGSVQFGKFISRDDHVTRIQAKGSPLEVANEAVFKYFGGKPRTPLGYRTEGKRTDLPLDSPILQSFLNSAAHLASLPGFRALGPEAQLQALVQYVRGFAKYDAAARQAEYYGLKDVSKILCAGAGTCRHQAVLLTQILAEAGYDVRLTGRFMSKAEGGFGHRWLEVVTQGQRFVVDPSSNVKQVVPYPEAVDKAAADPKSWYADWFAHPDRKFYPEILKR